MSNEEFISGTHDSDGVDLLMPCSTQELIPPLLEEGMLQWWHEVHGKEKGVKVGMFCRPVLKSCNFVSKIRLHWFLI
jgi:hypothetical protein